MSENEKVLVRSRRVRPWVIEVRGGDGVWSALAGHPDYTSSVEVVRVLRGLLKEDPEGVYRAVKVIGPVEAEAVTRVRVRGF